MFAFIINKGTEPGCSETHQIDTKLGQLVEQQPTGNTEMRYSCLGQSYHLGLPPPFGPDSPLALVSLLPGQTGLFYRSQVSRETDSEVRNQGIQSHTNYHTSGDRKQAKCLAKSKTRYCREKQEREVDRGPFPSCRSQASKGGKASPLNSECTWPST